MFNLSKSPAPIVLLTDFGLRDHYVGVMKGVIRRLCRSVEIIDLTHNVAPHDPSEAAFVLAASYRYFPPETIFVCVVDPGVGTARAVLCMSANGQTFLAPDNGLLSIVADQSKPQQVRQVTAKEYFLKEQSSTFHGRDIFAPVAARLAEGLDAAKLGPRVRNMRNLRLPKPLRTAEGSLRGEVVYIDQFGNLITNITRSTLERSFKAPAAQIEISVRRRTISGVSATYAAADEGELVALIGSTGYLELAVNGGAAAHLLACKKGEAVTLRIAQPVAEASSTP